MANISKRKVLVIAGVVRAFLRVRLSRCSSSIRLGGRPLSGPSRLTATAGYMIALGPLSAAWGFSMYIRCSDAKNPPLARGRGGSCCVLDACRVAEIPYSRRFGYRPAVVLLLHSHDGDPNVVRAVRDARRLAR